MERQRYLVDTNAVIDYLGSKLPTFGMFLINSLVNSNLNISIISKIELLGFNTTTEDHQLLVNFINDANLINLTDLIVERTIAIRKLYKIKLPDAIIAATALENKLILITRNMFDFQNIAGLTIINPYKVLD